MTEVSAEDAAIEQLQDAGLIDSGSLPLDDLDQEKASDGMRDLLSQVERDIVGWKPQPGDKVFGVITDITESEGGDYGPYPIVVIETPSGRLVGVHAFHIVLRNEIERKIKRGALQAGDEIAIQYRGEAPAGPGKNAAHMYRVAVRRPQL